MTGTSMRWQGPLAALYEALAAASPDLFTLGDAIGHSLLGPLAAVASVNLHDEVADRLELVGAAAADRDRMLQFRWYLETVPAASRNALSREVLVTGEPLRFDLTDADAPPPAQRPAFLERDAAHCVIVPLRTEDGILGTLQVGRAEPYDDDELALLATAGAASGPTVANALLVRRLRRTDRIARAMAGNIRLEQLFAAVLPELREILVVDTVRLLLLDEDGTTLHDAFTIGAEKEPRGEVPLGVGLEGRIAGERRPLVVEDLTTLAPPPAPLRDLGLASVAGVPVIRDALLGVLHVGSYTPRRFRDEDLELLTLVADRLALALQESQTEAALRRAEALAQSVLDTAADAIVTFDEHGIVHSANRSVERLFGYGSDELVGHSAALLISDQSGDEDDLVARWGLDGLPAAGEARAIVARRRDGTPLPVDLTISEVDAQFGTRLFTAILRDASDRVAAEERLRHQALHDALTGLPNRVLFREHLERALAQYIREGRQVAVMFLDLDRFKLVNDTLGHAAGDELLRQAAARLHDGVRPSDVLARLGGDEFAVLLEGIMPQDPVKVARRILRRFDQPFTIDGQPLRVATSIGIAHTRAGAEAPTAGDLLRDADAALYRAKGEGRGRFDVFDDAMRTWLHRRLQTENELHEAIVRGDIAVYYQPVLDLRTRRVHSLEALARWHHPVRGTVPADEFISVAEETGLIAPLGLQVTQQAARETVRLREHFGAAAPRIAINLSATQLSSPIGPILEAAEEQIGRLGVEITETTLMSDVDRVAGHLRDLKSRGATIIVDDFGTGYSSLAYLKRLPIDMVKIDRAFVERIHDDADDRAIVYAIIQLAHALGISVVAEGVETPRQLEILEEFNCDRAQGYLIARPEPADRLQRDSLARIARGAILGSSAAGRR